MEHAAKNSGNIPRSRHAGQESGRDGFRSLEWLGDSIVYHYATEMLVKRYPSRSFDALHVSTFIAEGAVKQSNHSVLFS